MKVVHYINRKCILKLTLGGAATVLFLSSAGLIVCSGGGAAVKVVIDAGLLSLLMLPLLSTTAGVSLSFFLLSVLTMGWSYGPGFAQSCKERYVSVFVLILHIHISL